MGLVVFLTVAVLYSLQFVSNQSAMMGAERRRAEAFSAAQAGLATAADELRQRIGASTGTYTAVMNTYGAYSTANADNPAPLGETWIEVYPWTSYRLLQGTAANAAIDTSVTEADRELRGRDGAAFLGFPEQSTVRYRVFIRDDADDGDSLTDVNRQVWVVSIGQVTDGNDTVIAQQVVHAMVRNDNVAAGEPSTYSFAGSGTVTTDAPPDVSIAPSVL